MQKLAKELRVVIPVSFFEEANNAHYNSIAIIDADGTDLGLYRKSHIPDGPGYQEKFYFNPGDTGFKWFPEAARAMVLQGAEILFYPAAIGSEPQDTGLDSRDHWKRVMQGHAGANVVPLVASNRVGKEIIETEHGNSEITFYGNSFIAGPTGEIVASADDKEEAVLVAEFDLDKIKSKRRSWGVFRDRRPDLYKVDQDHHGGFTSLHVAGNILIGCAFGARLYFFVIWKGATGFTLHILICTFVIFCLNVEMGLPLKPDVAQPNRSFGYEFYAILCPMEANIGGGNVLAHSSLACGCCFGNDDEEDEEEGERDEDEEERGRGWE
ncbi:nitrilase-like protein 1 [Actinidia rufa]|uniref:Nitrilase-like protein 1 n=1 Tax=Actinidia rufa TaxID=165716 RepID=A0A7J0GQP4_9ERIC|nr:nitrilase-like protein 1 [Actinidia rufa]